MTLHPKAIQSLALVCLLAAAPTFGQVSVFGPTGAVDGSESDFDAITITTPIGFSGGPAPGTVIEVVGGVDGGGGVPAISPVAFDDFTFEVAGNDNTVDDTLFTTFDDLGIGLFDGEHEAATLVFPEPVTAFAATFESPASSGGIEVTLAGIEIEADSFFLPGGGQGQQFLGFTSDTPFTTVTFTSNVGGGETFFLANIETGILIPEPASLLLVGLATVAGACRRRT